MTIFEIDDILSRGTTIFLKPELEGDHTMKKSTDMNVWAMPVGQDVTPTILRLRLAPFKS